MLLTLSWLLAVQPVAASNGHDCRNTRVATVVRSTDDAAPFVVTTRDHRRWRVLGNDFIDVRQWKPGERLHICVENREHRLFDVRNVERGEELVALPASVR